MRRDAVPLLAPAAPSTAGNRVVLVIGIVAVLGLAVAIVVMASRNGRAASSATASGSYPAAVPAADPAPAGMYATPADPAAVIDRTAAEQVLDTYWSTRRTALERDDVALLRSVAAGPTAEWEGSCRCVPTGPTVGEPYFSAPPQSGYPARFLAERKWQHTVAGDGQRGVQVVSDLIVFVRPSADEPWKAVIHAGVVGALPFDTVLPDPLAAPLPDLLPFVVPAVVPQALAAYFQSWWDTGAPPADTPVRDAGMVQARGEEIRAQRSSIEAQGATASATYQSGLAEDGIYEFAGGDSRLVCATVRWWSESRAAPGGLLAQPAPGSPFPSFVPDGHYTSIGTNGVRQFCAALHDQLDVVAMAGGDVSATYWGA